MSTYHGACDQMPYCCGFYEAGDFGREEDEDSFCYTMLTNDSPAELFDAFCEEAGGRPILFNFVRRRELEERWNTTKEELAASPFKKRFDAQWMRGIVRKHPKVIHVGRSINPGTLNEIDSYIIKDYQDASN